MRQVLFSIGGLYLMVESPATDVPLEVGGPVARFVIPPDATRTPDALVQVGWLTEPVAPSDPAACVFASGGTWNLYRADGGYRYDISSPVFGPQPYRVAWFDATYQTGRVWYRRDPAVVAAMSAPLEYPLDELLTTNLLARGRGVELHACAVVDTDGRGFLFVGQSGDGKTTMARLWSRAGATVISDDRVIVRHLDGRWLMFGTPWHGEAAFAEPVAAPLTRLFVLRHGPQERSEWLSPGQAAALLFARAFPPFYDSAAIDFTVGFLGELAAALPCEVLTFTPTPAAVDYARRRS
ncbi:MAG: hypothetical protein SNJ62_01515 [Chloracidobacterium sp.]